jgi:hypothetical protein
MARSSVLRVTQSIARRARTGVAKVAQPFVGTADAGDDHRAGAVALEEALVGVAALLGIPGVEAEVIEREHIDRHERTELGLVALGQAGGREGLEPVVGPHREDRGPPAADDGAEGVGEKGLVHADGVDDLRGWRSRGRDGTAYAPRRARVAGRAISRYPPSGRVFGVWRRRRRHPEAVPFRGGAGGFRVGLSRVR